GAAGIVEAAEKIHERAGAGEGDGGGTGRAEAVGEAAADEEWAARAVERDAIGEIDAEIDRLRDGGVVRDAGDEGDGIAGQREGGCARVENDIGITCAGGRVIDGIEAEETAEIERISRGERGTPVGGVAPIGG